MKNFGILCFSFLIALPAFAGYRVAESNGAGLQCFNANNAGRIYDDYVDQSLCHAYYKVGLSKGAGYQCFHADYTGRIYGLYVDQNLCQTR